MDEAIGNIDCLHVYLNIAGPRRLNGERFIGKLRADMGAVKNQIFKVGFDIVFVDRPPIPVFWSLIRYVQARRP